MTQARATTRTGRGSMSLAVALLCALVLPFSGAQGGHEKVGGIVRAGVGTSQCNTFNPGCLLFTGPNEMSVGGVIGGCNPGPGSTFEQDLNPFVSVRDIGDYTGRATRRAVFKVEDWNSTGSEFVFVGLRDENCRSMITGALDHYTLQLRRGETTRITIPRYSKWVVVYTFRVLLLNTQWSLTFDH